MKKSNLFVLLAVIIAFIAFRKKIFTTVGGLMSRGMRNNNPFNLRYSFSAWVGRIGRDVAGLPEGDTGFCIFDTLENGVRAGVKNLKNGYFSKRLTITNLVMKYAPASDNNNVGNYVGLLCKQASHFHPDYIPENMADYVLICQGIIKMENGFNSVPEEFIVKWLNG